MTEIMAEMEEHGGAGVVVVDPKPSKGFTSKVVDWLENLMVKLMFDSSQPQHYLSGNFAPVRDETPPCKNLPVIGYLPVGQTDETLFFLRKHLAECV